MFTNIQKEYFYSFILPEERPKVWMSGDEYQILVDAQNSNNTMTLLNAVVPPNSGPPAHLHSDVDELFVVTEGKIEFTVDDKCHEMTSGSCIYVGRNVPHGFINKSDNIAKMLIFYSPAGVENFFFAAGLPYENDVAPPKRDNNAVKREIEIASSFRITSAIDKISRE